MKKMILALEEEATGKTVIEQELVYYARLESLDTLKAASGSEEQEQWEIRIPKTEKNLSSGRMRVRKTTKDGNTEYVITTKIKREDGHEMETSVPSTEDAFTQFKLLSDAGMKKTRYFFPVEGRKEQFEVDVFPLADGKTSNWVKIDFEIIDDSTVAPLPEGFLDAISSKSPEKEDKDFIWNLYEKVILVSATR